VKSASEKKVDVSPADFEEILEVPSDGEPYNIDLLMDIPLEVRVELGGTRKLLKEVLALGPGSIVELNKLAGEPVDVLVNGQPIAKGEVVVIDENFGVRVSDILSPQDRLKKLGR
jgi:flagellar motor switch protein FliN/FliY